MIKNVRLLSLKVGCSWDLDGIPKWKQDLWNCSAIAELPGGGLILLFQTQRDEPRTKKATEERSGAA